MREILFRGKRTDTGEWVEGLLYKELNNFYGKSLFNIQRINKFGIPIAVYEINPETVGQYTGLTDKNGKRIWENDIVKVYCDADGHFDTQKDVFGKIVFDDDTFYDWEISYNHIRYGCEESMCNQKYNIEVVGNSIDNPELLTAERIGENEN